MMHKYRSAKNLAKGMFEKLQPIFSIWRMREDGERARRTVVGW